MSDIFISYKREEKGAAFVETLRQALIDKGYDAWYDSDIPGGTQWRRSLLNAIFQCQALIVIFTKSAMVSSWVSMECNIAFALGKIVLPVLVDVLPEEIPDYLQARQAVRHTTSDAETCAAIVVAIHQLLPKPQQNSFWYDLFAAGLDICVPLISYPEHDVVHLPAIKAALTLEDELLKRYYPYFQNPDPTNILPIDIEGGGVNYERNWVIIGGPGRMPFVHDLLKTWSGAKSSEQLSAYRFVVRSDLAEGGPFVKSVAEGEEYAIEDVQRGKVVKRHEVVQQTAFKAGTNYGIVYTSGIAGHSVSSAAPKVIILAAFTRSVLPGLIQFLLDDETRIRWVKAVKQCGAHSETLLRFRIGTTGAELTKLHPPRPLGQPQ